MMLVLSGDFPAGRPQNRMLTFRSTVRPDDVASFIDGHRLWASSTRTKCSDVGHDAFSP